MSQGAAWPDFVCPLGRPHCPSGIEQHFLPESLPGRRDSRTRNGLRSLLSPALRGWHPCITA